MVNSVNMLELVKKLQFFRVDLYAKLLIKFKNFGEK